MDASNVQYYCHHIKELKYSQQHKVKKFLENDCIKYSDGVFFCEPLEGYNTRTYTIVKNDSFPCGFECNCQGFQQKVRRGEYATCSHVGAVYGFLKILNFKKKQGVAN